jgi:hypothetical protein
MKAFVIAIPNHEKSQEAADRCIESGKRYGIEISKFDAITPDTHDIYEICERLGISTKGFLGNNYSKLDNVISCFLSHFTLWKSCVNNNTPYVIFEHDVVIDGPIPPLPKFVGTFGKPSFGKFNTPTTLGWGKLTSKRYFPGAHAYMVTPIGAHMLCNEALVDAKPTDVFLDIRKFIWLEEYYPWSATVHDSFSTVQKIAGCMAKHNFNSEYEFLEE